MIEGTVTTAVPFTTEKIWDEQRIIQADGPFLGERPNLRGEIHPDLIRHKDYWYCGFKEGDHTCRGVRLIRSADGKQWESVRRFTWSSGHRVMEPRFSVTADGALMLSTWVTGPVAGQQADTTRKSLSRRSSVTWLSHDGLDWGHVHACPTGIDAPPRFGVTWDRGIGYSVQIHTGNLYRTLDGKQWDLLTQNIFSSWKPTAVSEQMLRSVDPHDIMQADGQAPRQPHETVLAFDPHDGTAWAIARVHPFFALLGTAAAPDYTDWRWRAMRVDWNGDGQTRPAPEKLGVQIGGPVLKYLSNGTLIAAGRADASTPDRPQGRLTLFTVDRENAVLKRWVAFQGYSHYPGIVEHEGELWIVCGKQQLADPFAVYLLRTPAAL